MRQIIKNQILPQVQKPARYLGTEWNAVQKDWSSIPLKMAFAFPDIYEIGMSHLGLQILYGLVNAREDTLLERVFAPGEDLEALLREKKIPLFSLESFNPIRDFDLVGFTLQYEMSFTNILNMLDLAGIPLRTAGRNGTDPIILGGGPVSANPEPIAPFFDLILLGDGEEALPQLLDLAKEWKEKHGRLDREGFLLAAAKIAGIYVPKLYRDEYSLAGKFLATKPLHSEAPSKVYRRIVKDLEAAYFPTRPIVPFIETVHDRGMVEVLRGCTRGCRFCQAGIIYRPVRERSPELLARQAQDLLLSTGYDELSLTSLSTADYTCLEPLLKSLSSHPKFTGVNISLPSLRADAFSVGIAKELQKGRKTGLTFAPEAGTQRLRDVINKGVKEEDLMSAVTAAFEAGWTGIKLYFMMGLPTETTEDIAGIADLAHKVYQAGLEINRRHKRKKKIRVSISVAAYVPKAHTPFQWESQDLPEMMQKKQQYLKGLIKKPIIYTYHDAELSFLEAVFAKGDRRLATVLEEAWKTGSKFDSWREHFSFANWLKAFEKVGIDPHFYANRSLELDETLPWDHLDMGVSKRFLLRERAKAFEARLTPDCREGHCTACELCPDFGVDLVLKGAKINAFKD
ncbi:MAG: TIGR03960 family B12-binding radical SAM protein [Bacillota bacterium]